MFCKARSSSNVSSDFGEYEVHSSEYAEYYKHDRVCKVIEIDYETEYAEYELSKDWETSTKRTNISKMIVIFVLLLILSGFLVTGIVIAIGQPVLYPTTTTTTTTTSTTTTTETPIPESLELAGI